MVELPLLLVNFDGFDVACSYMSFESIFCFGYLFSMEFMHMSFIFPHLFGENDVNNIVLRRGLFDNRRLDALLSFTPSDFITSSVLSARSVLATSLATSTRFTICRQGMSDFGKHDMNVMADISQPNR